MPNRAYISERIQHYTLCTRLQIDIELSYVNNGPIIYKKRKIDDVIIIFFLLIYDCLVKLYRSDIYAKPNKRKQTMSDKINLNNHFELSVH